ncbi:hypothetical protein KP509_19G018900 [Ceratopteris richardii]|nr:hypothetical protein KP509_19G018900 [Ceratopteris richardii]
MSSTRWSSKTVPNVISSRPVEQKPVGLRRSCSVTGVVTVSAGKKAVQRFLEGPPQLIEGDDVYLQDCKELLRMLTARRNRVPGFV